MKGSSIKIKKDTIKLLEDIRENNNKPWFVSQRERYLEAQQNVKDFLAHTSEKMGDIDRIEKNKLFRIYRDVRFSKDKTPLNSHWSMSWMREKPYLRGGYYLRLNPEGGFIACGFWSPNSSDLALIRGSIDTDPKAFRKAIAHKSIKNTFGELEGDQVKTSPKGYSKDHPDIDLIRFKQFIFSKTFTRKEIHKEDFAKEVIKTYKSIRPFFDYMSDVLGHNLNGEPLY